jgi:hypothetical protein
VTRARTLERAVALAGRRPEDPEALAGAADVISLLASVGAKPDAVALHVMTVLDRRFIPDGNGAAARAEARELYARALGEEEIDVHVAPTAVALRLYRRAEEKDTRGRLVYLPLRLYTLTAAFDRRRAAEMLGDLDRRQPRNAAVALERARAGMVLDGKADPLAQHREAARRTAFARSFFVGIPATLRATLRLHRGLSAACKNTWPGYDRVLQPLLDAQLRGRDTAVRAEAVLRRLGLAERLCAAQDYADVACGIDLKTRALTALLGMKDALSPEQRAVLEARLAEHGRTLAGFPGERLMLAVNPDGVHSQRYPAAGRQSFSNNRSPSTLVFSSGIVMTSLRPDQR